MTGDGLAGAPLTAAQLETVLERNLKGKGYPMDVPDLVAALRAAWAEVAEERARADHHEGRYLDRIDALKERNKRYRETLEWVLTGHTSTRTASHDCLMCQRVRAALAAPGAGGEQEGA